MNYLDPFINYLLELVRWTMDSPFLAVAILIIAYVVLFTLYNQKRFRRLALAFKYPFGFYDGLVNITAFSILMIELPQLQKKEFTVTARLKRYKSIPVSWNWDSPATWLKMYHYYIGMSLCYLANKFDPGHC